MKTSPLTSSDLFAALGLSLSIYMLAGPLLVGLGSLGIVLMQLVAFALPALLLAATRDAGWQAIGWQRCRPAVLISAALLACSLWYWNAYWVAPIGADWASVEQMEALTDLLAIHDRSLLESLVLFALVPALCEELLHRGVIAPALARRLGFVPGLILSSLIFGLSHFNLARLLPTTVLGMAAGFVRLRTGSLVPAMLVHFLYNACLLVATRAALTLSTPVALVSVGATTIALVFSYNLSKSQEILIS